MRQPRPERRTARTIACKQCGKTFTTAASQVRRGRTCCSRRCYGLLRRGENHPAWRGGRVKTSDGYVMTWVGRDDPMASMATAKNKVLEHRLVMARVLGRPLAKGETVHHINGVREDNRPENLELRFGHHGQGQTYCCADCGSRKLVSVPIG